VGEHTEDDAQAETVIARPRMLLGVHNQRQAKVLRLIALNISKLRTLGEHC